MGAATGCVKLHNGRGRIATALVLALVACAPGCGSSDKPRRKAGRTQPAARPAKAAAPAKTKADESGGYFVTLIRSKKAAETMAQKVQMKALWTSLNTSAMASGGRFPAKLSDLRDPRLLKAPGPAGQPYRYVPGQRTDSPRPNVLVYEEKPVHNGKVLVLRVGGAIDLLTPEQLAEAVRKTHAALRK